MSAAALAQRVDDIRLGYLPPCAIDYEKVEEREIFFAPMPPRKLLMLNVADNAYDLAYFSLAGDRAVLIEAKSSAPDGATKHLRRSAYPRYLAKIFGVGVGVFIVGLLLLLCGAIISSSSAQGAAAALLVLGSTAAVLSLLRAQDIDERAA